MTTKMMILTKSKIGNALNDEEALHAAKAVKKATNKEQEKSRRAGLCQEIADLKGQLDLEDVNRTPQMGAVLAEFY